MKRLAFPALFTVVLLGVWVFTRAMGDATPTPSTSSTQTAPSSSLKPSPVKPEPLTDKEEMFAATLSPQNQEIFSEVMTRKQRTMAMEMMVENNRSGGSLNSDQAVEVLYKDLELGKVQESVAPTPMPPPSASASPAKPVPQPQPVGPPSGSKPSSQPTPQAKPAQ